MNKTIKIYIGLLILLFIGAIAIEFSSQPPIDWTPTYNEDDKNPYGTYIIFNELETLFPKSKVQTIKITPYEFFDNYYDWEDEEYLISGTYMLITNYREIDNSSAQEILDFVSHGNDVFFSSNYLPRRFKDSLHLELDDRFNSYNKPQLSLVNPIFKNDSISFDKATSNTFFSKIDTLNTTVLGYQKFDSIPRVNYIKVKHVEGNIYLHLQPIVFTNYSLLKHNYKDYAESVLSYLSDETIYFDSTNKKGKNLGQSPMRFILSNPALRSGWYLALASLLLFMIFNAKRKQRIVKVIKPLENTTIAFTKTIGNLYYETKDHNNLIEKKITYFLEYIRRVYYINTDVLDDKFIKTLALKSGKQTSEIKNIVNLIAYLKSRPDCTEGDLLDLNKKIEDFYNT